jgi:hypothetical protein
MCDPIMGATLFTLPGLGAVSVGSALGVGGALMSAVGALKAGASAEKIGAYNAAATQQQAAADEATQRRRSGAVLAQARANAGASGIELSGSPLDVIANSAAEAELDALNIRYGGQVRAERAMIEGRVARANSYTAAAGSLMQGLSSASRGSKPAPQDGGGGTAGNWLLETTSDGRGWE